MFVDAMGVLTISAQRRYTLSAPKGGLPYKRVPAHGAHANEADRISG